MVNKSHIFENTFIHNFISNVVIPEFLLGKNILAAPVVQKGDEYRHIYLPRGEWFDPNQNKIHIGPTWLMDYPAPLDVLPYFICREWIH